MVIGYLGVIGLALPPFFPFLIQIQMILIKRMVHNTGDFSFPHRKHYIKKIFQTQPNLGQQGHNKLAEQTSARKQKAPS